MNSDSFRKKLEQLLAPHVVLKAREKYLAELLRMISAANSEALISGLLKTYLSSYGSFPVDITDNDARYDFREKVIVARLSTRVFEILVERNIEKIAGFADLVEEIVNNRINSTGWLNLQVHWRYTQALSFYNFEVISASAGGARRVVAADFDKIRKAVIAFRSRETNKLTTRLNKETILDELKREHARQRSGLPLADFNPVSDEAYRAKLKREFDRHNQVLRSIARQIHRGKNAGMLIELLVKRFNAFCKYLDEQRNTNLALFQLLAFAREQVRTDSKDYLSHEIYLQVLYAIQYRALANRKLIQAIVNADTGDQEFFLLPFDSYIFYKATFRNRIIFSNKNRKGEKLSIDDFFETSRCYLRAYYYGITTGIDLASDIQAIPIQEELQLAMDDRQTRERIRNRKYVIPPNDNKPNVGSGTFKIGTKILLDKSEKEFGIVHIDGNKIFITNERFYPLIFQVPENRFIAVIEDQVFDYVYLKTKSFFPDMLGYFLLAFNLASLLLTFQSRGLWGLFKAILEDEIEDRAIDFVAKEAKDLGFKNVDKYIEVAQSLQFARSTYRGVSDTRKANKFENRGIDTDFKNSRRIKDEGDAKTEVDQLLDKVVVRDEVMEMNSGLPLRIRDIKKYLEGLKKKPRIPTEWRLAFENSEPLRRLAKDAENVELVRVNNNMMGEHPAHFQKSSMGSEYELHVTLEGKSYKLDGVFVKEQDGKYVSYIGEAKFTYKGDMSDFHTPGKKNPTGSYHFTMLDDKVRPQFKKYSDLAKKYGFEGVAVVTNTEFLWQTFEQRMRDLRNVQIYFMSYDFKKKIAETPGIIEKGPGG